MLEILKKLCQLPGVSGAEDAVRDYISGIASEYADEIRTDALGNLLVFKKGKKQPDRPLMLAAHMDEVGIMIKSITDEGYLKFAFVGGIDKRVVIGKKLLIGTELIPAVVGVKPIHLVKSEEKGIIPKLEELYLDIGAKDREDAEKLVQIGDYGIFDDDVSELGDGLIKAKALDDRIGCYVLLELLKRDLPVDAWFAFTVQEEVGTRGAFTAAYSVNPAIALIVEGTTAADFPKVDESRRVCSVGKGVVIPFMDRGAIYDRELFEKLRNLSDEKGIPWQLKQAVSGGTDATAIQRTKTGVRVCAVAAAVRNIHSPSGIACIKDIKALYNLAFCFMESM